jgi:antitoxin CptB
VAWPDEIDFRRLRMRSWRRGTREMDLILGPFADGALHALSADMLRAYEDLLSENDQDLYLWIGGTGAAPEPFRKIVQEIRSFHAA